MKMYWGRHKNIFCFALYIMFEEDVFMMSWIRLHHDKYLHKNLGHTSSRHLQVVFKMLYQDKYLWNSWSWQYVFKTYCSRQIATEKIILAVGFLTFLQWQKQSPRGVSKKICSKRFRKIHRKTRVPDSLL